MFNNYLFTFCFHSFYTSWQISKASISHRRTTCFAYFDGFLNQFIRFIFIVRLTTGFISFNDVVSFCISFNSLAHFWRMNTRLFYNSHLFLCRICCFKITVQNNFSLCLFNVQCNLPLVRSYICFILKHIQKLSFSLWIYFIFKGGWSTWNKNHLSTKHSHDLS